MLAGAVCQGSAVGTGVPLLGFLVLGDGSFNAFQPFCVALFEPLIGFPSFFAALLVDVMGRVSLFSVSLPLGCDALVHGIGVIATAALG